ncbi:MAG: glycosyltransferase [Bacteroidales bacterium]|nr:glycosyltransferase [Bacteroidales bacterium]
MSNPKISIIIPVYNIEKYIAACLDSLINQTLKDIEIICVNDGSTDHSLEILNEYAENDERLIIKDQINQGVSAARNFGLRVASGEFIMFVDSDDWVDKRISEELYNSAKGENADCVMCSYVKEFGNHSVVNHVFDDEYLVWEENEVKNNFHRRLFGLNGKELQNPAHGDIIVSPCMKLFKSQLAQKHYFMDLKEIGTFEDGLYQIMVYHNCKKYIYIDKPYYHYRKTNESSLTTKYNPYLFEKWQNLYDIMNNIIVENSYDESYIDALNNRIVLSMIGLGLNEISAKNKSIFRKSETLKHILKTERYEEAFAKFKFDFLPFEWKIFFILCKYKLTFLLVLMLISIDFLRKRVS